MGPRVLVLVCGVVVAATTLLAFGAARAAAVGFFPATTQTTSSAPYRIATGDFNEDGHVDLAAAEFRANTIGVMIGDGQGGFTEGSVIPTGLSPQAVAVGEFTSSDHQDLVSANFNANTVSVALGDGAGHFGSSRDFATGTSPQDVAVGDFNDDGYLDVVTANWSSWTVSVLLGNGDGTCKPKVDYPAGEHAQAVCVGDFNGDDVLDLAVADRTYANYVSVLLGNGDGTFGAPTQYTASHAPGAIATADVDGDGILDLAVTSSESDIVSVLPGHGDGTFGAETRCAVGHYPTAVTAVDLNNDGYADLATSNLGSRDVSVLISKRDGSFSPELRFASATVATDVCAGDFNGDGWQDLATGNFEDTWASVLLRGLAVTVTAGANGSISPTTGLVHPGEDSPTYRMQPDLGYHLATLTVDDTVEAPQDTWTFTNVQTDHSLAATFAIDTFRITASVVGGASGHGSISPAGAQTVDWRSTPTYRFTPATGYHVSEVRIDGTPVSMTSPNQYTFTPVSADHSITVAFAIDTFTITPSVDETGHGAISPSAPLTTDWHSRPTFTFVPEADYHVATVRVDGRLVALTGPNTYAFPAVETSHVIEVTFAIDTFVIVPYVVGGHGSISPGTTLGVDLHDTPTFTFTPDSGYEVERVLVDGQPVSTAGTNAYTFPAVTADHAISVEFATRSDPSLGKPDCPRKVRSGVEFQVRGAFGPRKAVADVDVRLQAYRYERGAWKPFKVYDADVTVSSRGVSYRAAIAIAKRGTYCFRAESARTAHWHAAESSLGGQVRIR